MNHLYRFLPLALAVTTVLCMEACGQGVRGFGTPEGVLPINVLKTHSD